MASGRIRGRLVARAKLPGEAFAKLGMLPEKSLILVRVHPDRPRRLGIRINL